MVYARCAIGKVWRQKQCLKTVLAYGIFLYTIEVEDNKKIPPKSSVFQRAGSAWFLPLPNLPTFLSPTNFLIKNSDYSAAMSSVISLIQFPREVSDVIPQLFPSVVPQIICSLLGVICW